MKSTMETSRCRVCNNAADKTCSACHSVSYCSLEHQRKDWKEHKKSCRIYVIKKNDVLGRYVVAARDIPAGTVIMDDHPVAYGPKQNTRPICLGCYKLVNGSYRCTKCQLPLCGKACQEVMMMTVLNSKNTLHLFQLLVSHETGFWQPLNYGSFVFNRSEKISSAKNEY